MLSIVFESAGEAANVPFPKVRRMANLYESRLAEIDWVDKSRSKPTQIPTVIAVYCGRTCWEKMRQSESSQLILGQSGCYLQILRSYTRGSSAQ